LKRISCRGLNVFRPVRIILATSGPLLFLLLASGCTLSYSAYVANVTDSPLFANLSYEWKGIRYEQEGALVRPGDAVELRHTGERDLRVRDLTGQTVVLQNVGTEDTQHAVTELEPLVDAPRLGIPGDSGPEGPSRAQRVTCVDGDRKELPLFHMTITVINESSRPLVVSFVEDYWEDVETEPRGELVIPSGDAVLSRYIVQSGWVRAFDDDGRVVFTQELERREFPVVKIPAQLPPDPKPIPVFEGSSDCLIFAGFAAVAIGLGVAAMVIGAALYWQRLRRKRGAQPRTV
jgi:hypothetical protein